MSSEDKVNIPFKIPLKVKEESDLNLMRSPFHSVLNFYLNFHNCLHSMNNICRKSAVYPVLRTIIPDDKVSWSIPWPSYSPQYFTAEHLKNCSWADPEIDDENFKPTWNVKDGGIDRRSYDNNQSITYDVIDNYPLNPRGRTGLCGRGRLGRWGPNHAADAVVTRWKRSSDKSKIMNSSKNQPILQFLAIQRKDCGKWAIPGGFLDVNEESSTAVIRELFEEAINVDKFSDDNKAVIENFFCTGKQVYKGYVDDPRNTDNAWIETTATNFHDESGEVTDKLVLEARDDAADVKWVDIVKDMEIYETHCDIIKTVNEFHLQSAEAKD